MIFKKNFRFPKFPLFNPLASFDLNLLEKGWTKKFKNGLKSFHISHPSICTVYLFWVRRLIQMSSPDRAGVRNDEAQCIAMPVAFTIFISMSFVINYNNVTCTVLNFLSSQISLCYFNFFSFFLQFQLWHLISFYECKFT